jgi:hypothetical protein
LQPQQAGHDLKIVFDPVMHLLEQHIPVGQRPAQLSRLILVPVMSGCLPPGA